MLLIENHFWGRGDFYLINKNLDIFEDLQFFLFTINKNFLPACLFVSTIKIEIP